MDKAKLSYRSLKSCLMSVLRRVSSNGYLLCLLVLIYVSSFYLYIGLTLGQPITGDEDLHVAAGIMYLARLPFMYIGGTALPFHYWHPAFAKLVMGAFVKGLSFLDFSGLCKTGCVTQFVNYDQITKGRIATAAVSSFAPVFLFLLVREVTGDGLAALASGEFLLKDYTAVWWSRAWLDPFAATFMVGALFFFYRAQKGMGREYYVLAGVFTGLSVASKYFGVLTVGVILLMYLSKVVNIRRLQLRRELVGLGLLVAAAAVAFYLADVTIWGRPDVFLASIRDQSGGGFGLDERAFVFIGTDSIGEAWGISETPLIPLVGLIISIPYALYLLVRSKEKRMGSLLLLAYLLVTVGFLTAILRKSPYYFVIAAPSVAALAGVGWLGLSQGIARLVNAVRTVPVTLISGIALTGILLFYFYSVENLTMGILLLAACIATSKTREARP